MSIHNRRPIAEPSSSYDPTKDDIPDDEKWRIIEQSGLLKRAPQQANPTKPASSSSKKPKGKGKDKDRESDDNDEAQGFEELKDEDDDFTWEEHVFQAVFFSLPFSVLYGTFVLLVNMQYRQDYLWSEIVLGSLKMFPVLLVIIYPTNRFKSSLVMQAIMTLAGMFCGSYLLYITSKASMYGTMLQTPGLATLWVYIIVQLDLAWALGGLAIIAVYYYWGLNK